MNLKNYPVQAYLLCGWPLILAGFGGALGGGLGAMAFVLNLKIYDSTMALPMKIFANLGIGLGAFVLWALIGSIIHQMFFA